MFHTVRLFSGLAGMCIVGFIFWMFVIAFVDFNTSEFRNLVPSANYLSTSYSEKVNSVMKTPKEFLRIALENAIHTDRSEPATTVNSTSGKSIDISPFQFMDYYSQLASMSGWVANGTGLTVSEMFYVMNLGDPSRLNFTNSITAPYSVAMWTQNRLAFRADLRTLRAKGLLDPNETIIVPSKNPPPYVTVDLPVDMDVPSWMMAVGSLFANAKSRDAIPVLLTIKAHAAAQHFENITMHQVSYSTLTSNKGEVIEIIPKDVPNKETKLRQSSHKWKVDESTRWSIRTLLTFKRDIYNQSIVLLVDKLYEMMQSAPDVREWALPSMVAVHVNLGKSPSPVADERRLLRAVLHYQRLHSPVLFYLFCSDVGYCKQLFTEPNIVFVENVTSEVSVALTSLMDFVILTDSVEGWLGAYLGDAVEVSYINNEKNEDYYYTLPDWKRF